MEACIDFPVLNQYEARYNFLFVLLGVALDHFLLNVMSSYPGSSFIFITDLEWLVTIHSSFGHGILMYVQIYELNSFNLPTLYLSLVLPSGHLNISAILLIMFACYCFSFPFFLFHFFPVALYPDLTCFSLAHKIISNSVQCDFSSHTLRFHC